MGRKATPQEKIKMKEYYERNREKLNNESKIRYNKNKKVISRKARENYLKNKEDILKYTSEWRKKRNKDGKLWKSPKDISSAQGTARYFVELKPCCEICGSTINLQRHHWNYNKPLLVNTLCKECHDIQHVKNFYESRFAGVVA
jgi:hypothetical protein